MADDDQDLVSNVKVEGVEESTKQLEEFGDKGAEAFGKIGAAAAAAGVAVGKGTSAIDKGAKSAGDSTKQLGDNINNIKGEPTAKELNAISDAARDLSSRTVKVSKDLAQFATRVTALATAGAAAIAGIAKLGASISSQINQTTSAFEQNNAAQQRAVASSASAQQSAIQFADQQSKLNRQFANGTIDYDTFSKTLKQNRDNYRDQIKVTEQLAFVQETAREETERLQKQLADRKAFTDLSDKFGGPLLSSLIALGNTAIAVKNQFIQAFGPGASAFVDTLTQALNTNGAAIASFFSEAGAKISAFVSQNGPAIQQALSSIGAAAAAVFNGLIDALPTLLAFFNNQIVPAFRTVAGVVDSLVQGFNKIFGTNFTTGAAVIIVAITSMTGGFKLLLGLIGLVGPAITVLEALFSTLLGPIGLLVIAFTALYFAIDWQKFGANATAAGAAIINFFASIPGKITGFFSAIFQFVTDGWNTLVQATQDAWNGVVNFFAGIPDQVTSIFQSVWDSIVNGFATAFAQITSTLTGWVESAKGYLKPIIDAISKITAFFSGNDATGEAATQSFAGGGKVRGQGTSTSDSILAWLSNNEYVMKAKAVRKYGTAFMHAVNQGRLDLNGMIRGFAAGGSPFASVAPARAVFAAAPIRQVSGGRILNLHLGDQEFRNLIIPDDDTANALERYTNQRRMNSSGRPPSWTNPKR